MVEITDFGFVALWSPYFFLFILGVTGLFFYITVYKWKEFKNGEPLKLKEAILFPITMLLIYIMKGSPIDLLGHIMFTFHMLQMAVLFLFIPQLFIISIPKWAWKTIIDLPIIRPIFKFFTKPLIALILFNGIFSFYHIPFIFDIVKTNALYHSVYTIILFILAIFMWWPLINHVEQKTLSGVAKLGFLLAASVLLTPACALIIFSKTPLYGTYSNPDMWIQSLHLCVPLDRIHTLNLSGPEALSFMPLLSDQQLGGVIMKILQEIFYGMILFKIFIEWYQKENEVDPIVHYNSKLNTEK